MTREKCEYTDCTAVVSGANKYCQPHFVWLTKQHTCLGCGRHKVLSEVLSASEGAEPWAVETNRGWRWQVHQLLALYQPSGSARRFVHWVFQVSRQSEESDGP